MTSNPYAGEGLIGLVFLGAFSVGLWRSESKLRTALYTAVAFAAGVVAFAVAGFFTGLSGEAAGYIGVSLGLLCAALAALMHSRLSKARSEAAEDAKN